LYLLAAVFLAAIISLAWWTRLAETPRVHEVRTGETLDGIADEYEVSPADLAEANDDTVSTIVIEPGETLVVPTTPPSGLDVWYAHAAGLGAEILGVLLSFWLALIAGMTPSGYRKQILGISVVLGIASYASTWAVTDAVPLLTPRFVFSALKDGFAWSAAFPMFAAAFGFGRAARSGVSSAPAPRASAGTADPAPPPPPPAEERDVHLED
jgi:LysM repeat protein